MAIIQSILVGKGKGKIGNVVLSGLKGQTVAKQLNSSPSNPRTVAQTANRVKMANAVLAWQFLANFMNNAKGLRKPLESVYNAFIRSVVKVMAPVLSPSRAYAAFDALNAKALFGNWFTIALVKLEGGYMTVSLSSTGMAWSPSVRVCAMVLNPSLNAQTVVDRSVSESEFNSGSFELMVDTESVDNSGAVYIYDSASSKITNIAFLEV